MQYTLNTHNIRHLLSKHNTVTTPHSHMCNLISYVNSPARLRCAGGEINRIHSSVHSQFIGNRNSNSSAVSSHAKSLFGCHLAYGVHWKSPYWLKGTNHCVRGLSPVRSVWYTWIGVFCVLLSAVTTRSPTSVLCMLVTWKIKEKRTETGKKKPNIYTS